MYDILNNIGIPNEIGFDIDMYMFNDFFLQKKSRENFLNAINTIVEKIKENYGIDETLQLSFEFFLSILSYNGKKCIKINEKYVIASIYKYFNEDYNENEISHVFLNQSEEEYINKQTENISELKKFLKIKIDQLAHVRSLEDLKKVSPKLYNSYLNAEQKDKNFHWNEENLKFEIEQDVQKFRRLRIWLSEFIKDISKPLDPSLFDGMDEDKIKLYLAAQYFNLSIYFNEPNRSILIDLAKKYANAINDDSVLIENLYVWDIYFDDNNDRNTRIINIKDFNKKYLDESLDEFLNDNNRLKISVNKLNGYNNLFFENFKFDEINKYLMKVIKEGMDLSKKMGASDIEIKSKLIELEKKVNFNDLKATELRKIKHQIERLNMVLKKIKPNKTQEGGGKFKGFYVYYYENSGMVAIDKIDSDAGLYIMPINIYISILKNKKYENDSLYNIRKIAGVNFISHNRKNWLDDARKLIYSKTITEDEMKAFDEILPIEFSYSLDKLNELENQYKNNEIALKEIKRRKIEITNKTKEIDDEIKENVIAMSLSEEEKEELLEAEIDLFAKSDNSDDFILLHELASQKKYKVKRNPEVSLKTKLRTMDEFGAYHCDFCDSANFSLDLYDAHHIIPISQGGIDNIYNTACLCPSCHRKFHSKIPPTFAQKGQLLMKVKERIEKSNPEYLSYFEKLFNPNYHLDNGLSDEELTIKYQSEQEYYEKHKEQEDLKFLVDWNTPKKR